jgi:Leucine-rich repeat (LRR) protein
VIYHTRLAGSQRPTLGLTHLDGIKISLHERMQAFSRVHTSSEAQEQFRWWLSLRNYSGTDSSLSIPFNLHLQHLILRDCQLSQVPDLGCFHLLSHLDLSSNPLVSIPGLEKLLCLRFFDVSECPLLAFEETLTQLEQLHALVEVHLSTYGEESGNLRNSADVVYRGGIIQRLLPHHSKLLALDGVSWLIFTGRHVANVPCRRRSPPKSG